MRADESRYQTLVFREKRLAYNELLGFETYHVKLVSAI